MTIDDYHGRVRAVGEWVCGKTNDEPALSQLILDYALCGAINGDYGFTDHRGSGDAMRLHVTSRPITTTLGGGSMAPGYVEWRFSAEVTSAKRPSPSDLTIPRSNCAVYSDRASRTGFFVDVCGMDSHIFRFSPVDRSLTLVLDDAGTGTRCDMQNWQWSFLAAKKISGVVTPHFIGSYDVASLAGKSQTYGVKIRPASFTVGTARRLRITDAFQGFDEHISLMYSDVNSEGVRVYRRDEFTPKTWEWTRGAPCTYTNCSKLDLAMDVLCNGVWVKYGTRVVPMIYAKPDPSKLYVGSGGLADFAALRHNIEATASEHRQHARLWDISKAASRWGFSTVDASEYDITQEAWDRAPLDTDGVNDDDTDGDADADGDENDEDDGAPVADVDTEPTPKRQRLSS
jgi:hypothetical protein